MDRINIRTPENWKALDRLIILIAVIIFVILIVVLVFSPRLLPFGCCSESRLGSGGGIAEAVNPEAPLPVDVSTKEPLYERSVQTTEPLRSVPPSESVQGSRSELKPTEFGLSIADGSVVVTGLVDSEITRQSLLRQVQRRFSQADLADRIRVSNDVRAPSGQAALAAFLTNLSADDRLSISWSNENVRISGIVESEARKVSLVNSLENNDFTHGLYSEISLVNQLEVSASAPSCGEILSAAEVEFARGSARLTAAGRAALTKLIPCLQADRYTIIGHTDSDGAEALNRALSKGRADTALFYLSTRGLDVNRFSTLGMGEEQPISDNDSIEGKAKNRRIEFRSEQ